jgi:hypothetical protein
MGRKRLYIPSLPPATQDLFPRVGNREWRLRFLPNQAPAHSGDASPTGFLMESKGGRHFLKFAPRSGTSSR